MTELFNSFISKAFLRSVWALEFEAFKGSEDEAALDDRLRRWASRKDLRETSAEAALIEEFFRDTWGYEQSGQASAEAGIFTLWPKFAIPGAGERGGVGAADLAIGYFHKEEKNPIPQVLCEFKDIRSGLDAPQKRKGNNRSPVRQCLDYLSHARRGLFPSDPILPTWGIVTDMNEFRLYWFDKGHHQSLRFTIHSEDLFKGSSLISTGEAARFDRFLFRKVFHRSSLISPTGRSLLIGLIGQQRFKDRQLENTFYSEYRKFRERLYLTLLERNGEADGRPSVNKESKRKRDGVYLSANKQFIAPLPIPPASEEDRATVAEKAKALQAAHTARRETLAKIERRLSTARMRNKPETWLFAGLKSKLDLITDAPARLDVDKKREWAEQRYDLDLAARYEVISARLVPGAALSPAFKEGELSMAVDGVPVIDRIFVDPAEGELILAQWKLLAATFSITEKTDGKKLANALRKLVVADNWMHRGQTTKPRSRSPTIVTIGSRLGLSGRLVEKRA